MMGAAWLLTFGDAGCCDALAGLATSGPQPQGFFSPVAAGDDGDQYRFADLYSESTALPLDDPGW